MASDTYIDSRPQALSVSQMPPEHRRIVDWMERSWVENIHGRNTLASEWERNIRFVRGEQDIKITNGQVHRYEPGEGEDFFMVNHIRVVLEVAEAKTSVGNLQLEITPQTADRLDREEVENASIAIQHAWQMLRIQELSQKLKRWTFATGTALYHDFWNPQGGKAIQLPLITDTGEMAPGGPTFWEGALGVKVYTAFELFPCPGYDELDEMPYFDILTYHPIAMVRQRYPDFVIRHGEAQQPPELRILDELRGETVTPEKETRLAILHRWIKPFHAPEHIVGETMPTGGVIRIANGQLLLEPQQPQAYIPAEPQPDDQPFEYPFSELRDQVVHGRFFGRGRVSDMISPQVQYNQILNDRARFRALTAWAKILYPSTMTGINEADLCSPRRMGAFQYHPSSNTSSGPVQMITPPSWPGYADAELLQSLEDLRITGGVTEPSLGIEPQRVDSARGVMALQQADENKLVPFVHRFKTCHERLASHLLNLAHAHYTTERYLRAGGAESAMRAHAISSQTLPRSARVRVILDSIFPLTLQGKLQLLGQMANVGLFNKDDPMHQQSASEFIEYLSPRNTFDPLRTFRRKAEEENILLLRGMPVPISPGLENPYIELPIHLSAANSAEYRLLPPPQQLPLARHIADTQTLIAMEQEQARQAALEAFAHIPNAEPAPEGASGETNQGSQSARVEARAGKGGS